MACCKGRIPLPTKKRICILLKKAGYEVLMSGITLVTPGFMNKIQKVMNTIMPDSAIAANMHKQMESGMKEDGRLKSSHPASQHERSSINSDKEGMNGYY